MAQILSAVLVLAQFALAAVIVLTADWDPPDRRLILAAIPGAALAIWSWLAMGLTRIRVQPQPSRQVQLVTSGPYRWIRHPMYTGLLLFTAALVPSGLTSWKIAVWISLAVVLDVKARYEERLLSERLEAYAEYRRRTARFVPFLY